MPKQGDLRLVDALQTSAESVVAVRLDHFKQRKQISTDVFGVRFLWDQYVGLSADVVSSSIHSIHYVQSNEELTDLHHC